MRKIFVVTLMLLWPAPPSYAQDCPTFPARGVQIIDAFLANPSMNALAKGTDDQRRELTRKIAEQMRFELGSWSTKSADPGRPQSKDSLALPMGSAGSFCNWDWQNGSTRLRSVDANTRGELLTDQHLLPTAAVNHLGDVPPIDPPPPADNSEVAALKAELATVTGAVLELREQVANLQQQQTATANDVASHKEGIERIDAFLAAKPIAATCKASVFGIPVSCRLE